MGCDWACMLRHSQPFWALLHHRPVASWHLLTHGVTLTCFVLFFNKQSDIQSSGRFKYLVSRAQSHSRRLFTMTAMYLKFIRMEIKTALTWCPLKQCAMSWCSFLVQTLLIFQKFINNTKAVSFWILLFLELIKWVQQSILSLYIIHQPYFPIVHQCPAKPRCENNHSMMSPVRPC